MRLPIEATVPSKTGATAYSSTLWSSDMDFDGCHIVDRAGSRTLFVKNFLMHGGNCAAVLWFNIFCKP